EAILAIDLETKEQVDEMVKKAAKRVGPFMQIHRTMVGCTSMALLIMTDTSGNFYIWIWIKFQKGKNFIMGKMKALASVNEYIATADRQAKKALKDIRKTIKSVAPDAEEVISYQIPGYKYHGMLVFFAAWKNH